MILYRIDRKKREEDGHGLDVHANINIGSAAACIVAIAFVRHQLLFNSDLCSIALAVLEFDAAMTYE